MGGSTDKNLPYFVVEMLASLAERGLCSGTVSVRLSVPLLPGCRYPGCGSTRPQHGRPAANASSAMFMPAVKGCGWTPLA